MSSFISSDLSYNLYSHVSSGLGKFFSEVYNQEIAGYNDLIFNHVKNTNTLWEEKLCNLIVDNLENDKEFIDIGANIGLISLGVNKIAREKGKNISNIHCFECDTSTFRMLVHNTILLSNSYVKLYPFAIANKSQLCLMSENNYNRGCNFIYNTFDGIGSNNYNYPFIPASNYYEKKCYVPALPMDSIAYQFKNIGVIKIDVEGFEYFVLLGAEDIISKYKPIIFIEIWDVNREKIFDLLINHHGYKLEWIEDQNYICHYQVIK